MLDAAVSNVLSVRPQRTTVAPSDATLRAMAAPMPRPAPVTTATCPDRGVIEFIESAPAFQSSVQSIGSGLQEYDALHLRMWRTEGVRARRRCRQTCVS